MSPSTPIPAPASTSIPIAAGEWASRLVASGRHQHRRAAVGRAHRHRQPGAGPERHRRWTARRRRCRHCIGLPASAFHDITSGSNGLNTRVGFDLVTGRGSPYATAGDSRFGRIQRQHRAVHLAGSAGDHQGTGAGGDAANTWPDGWTMRRPSGTFPSWGEANRPRPRRSRPGLAGRSSKFSRTR